MTEILFYSPVDDGAGFAIRLLPKVLASGQRLMLWVNDAAAAQSLNHTLWASDPNSFVPHCLADDALAAETPLLIAHPGMDTEHKPLPHHDVVINLADEPPRVFSRFAKLVELIGTSDAAKAAGRLRYRYYRDRGYALQHHDLTRQPVT